MDKVIDIIKYDSGKIKRIGLYLNGIKHGQWVAFFESGLVHWVGNYVEGREFGIWKEWYEFGGLKEECYYNEGIKVPLNFWDEVGKQLLNDGTGYTIEKFGTHEHDTYKHTYQNGEFKSEEKLQSVSYGKFRPSDPLI